MKIPACFRALVIGLFAAQAATGALKVGDPAPKLQVGRWVQGEAVKEFEGDKVYVVEFWATWCGPCIASIPHLNEFHQRFKDKGLVVIGQNVFEQDVTAVPGFVKKMGSKMSYRVALDDTTGDSKGFMAKNWLAAAGQNGIPCAFIVSKKGKIAFIGHPMSMKDATLEALLAEPSTAPVGAGTKPAVAAAPSAKSTELAKRAEAEIRAGKLDEAEATIAEVHESLDTGFSHIGGLLELELLIARNQADDAIQLSKLVCEDFAKNPAVLNGVAARLVSSPDSSSALQAAAEKIATPISSAAGEQQAAALSTLARIAWLKGEKARAVEIQSKAVSLAPAAETAAAKAALEAYQQDRLP
jgi:thiol-disulfide isomerase/thioredoxin